MTDKQKLQRITDILSETTGDILDLVYRILFMAESGIE
jgi:hypothetical protein